MGRISITFLRIKFNSEVKKSFTLIQIINSLKPPLNQKYIFLITELSFLKIYLSWEQFLEDTFIWYMMGGRTSNGYKVVSYVNPRDDIHAQELINEGKEWSKWSPDEVIKKASRFFKKEPYKNTLRPIIQYLNDMRCIRNGITHGSRDSAEKFKSLVRSKISYAPSRITPGDFLLKIESVTKKTFFQYYADFLIDASNKIVP